MNVPQGLQLPAADILNDFAEGKFVLTNLAAKRAKQIKEGAPPLVRCDSNHPLTIALAEIAAGKIKPMMPKDEPDMAVVEGDLSPSLDDTVPSELGLLLPALDESESELLGLGVGVVDGDHDDDELLEGAPTLSDILGDTELDDSQIDPPGEDTLSLNELAEEEEAEAEGEEAEA